MAAKRKASPRRASSSEYSFNPNSFNAQFASIHAKLKLQTEHFNGRLDRQDGCLNAIETQVRQTNGRVTGAEKEIIILTGLWNTKWARVAGWGVGAATATTALVQGFILLWKHFGGQS